MFISNLDWDVVSEANMKQITMVRVYLTESEKRLKKLLTYLHDESQVSGVTVLRGITGFGNSGKIHTASLLDLSCVIFSHNIKVNPAIIDKSNQLNIPLIRTSLSTSKTVITLHKLGVEN